MNKIAKIFSYVAFVFAFCCMAIGYAAVQDELIVNGIVSVNGYKNVEIDCTYTLAYTYDSTNKTVIINDTYYDPNTRENYKVIGIKENGFSATKIENSNITIDATTIEAFKLSENISTIGANAFTGLTNLKTFTVVDGNTAFTVQDGILFGIEDNTLTTLVRYPSMKEGSYYIVPATVLSITDGAFSENNSCKAIVTTQYSPSAWGSPVPNAFMLNPYGTGYDVASVAENETGYTVTFATTPTESTFLFQGNLYPGVEPNPTSLQTAEVDVNTVNLRRALCIEDTNGNHAQLYLSCYHTYAYGYMDGTTLNIYNGESVVIYGGVYDGTILFYDSGIYNLPSGEGSVSGAEIVPGFPSWSTVAETIQKVVIAKDITPDKIDGWFSGMSNCKELDLKKLDTTNIEADGKMEGMFLDCSGLDKLSLGASFGESGKKLHEYNTGLSDIITGWMSTKRINSSLVGSIVYENNNDIFSDNIPMGFENTYNAVTYCYATSSGDRSSPLYIYQRKYVPDENENFDGYTVKNIYSWVEFDNFETCKKPNKPSTTKPTGDDYGSWRGVESFRRSVTKVEIVDKITPRSLQNWFYEFSQCPRFVGLENIDTSKVTSMSRMFRDAVLLKDSDLKEFKIDTSNTKNLYEMFYNCRLLTNADGETFNFVTQDSVISNYAGMFKDCCSLKQVNLGNFVFDTEGVTVAWMFRECNSLTEFTLPQGTITILNNDTRLVNKYYGIDCMFFECSSLTNLDLSFIQVGIEVRAAATFADCTNLETIFVTDNFGTPIDTLHANQKLDNNVDDTAYNKDIFTGCTSLVGGSGTQFSDTHIDGTYARIDGGVDDEGYFTEKSPKHKAVSYG